MNKVYKNLERPGLIDSLRCGGSLLHFGIKGMKWGVRRYQNEDGSLTNAGRSRYGYGSVRVDARNAETKGYVTISRKGYNDVNVDNKSFRQFEKHVQEEALRSIERVYGVPYTTLVKTLDYNLDKGVSKETNTVIDECMELTLTELLKRQSKATENVSEKNFPKAPKLPKVEKNKYANKSFTAEQAIDKAYEDLERLIPNYHDLSQDDQDRLWMEYSNRTGLYKYT